MHTRTVAWGFKGVTNGGIYVEAHVKEMKAVGTSRARLQGIWMPEKETGLYAVDGRGVTGCFQTKVKKIKLSKEIVWTVIWMQCSIQFSSV